MGPPDIHGLLQSYAPKRRLSIDQILEQNDEAAEQIKF